MTDRIPLAQHTKASLDQLYDDLDRARMLADPELHGRLTAAIAALGKSETELKTSRSTSRRLNLRAQQLESELATYRRAISTWEFTERGTYVPLRSITAMAKAAGVGYDATRYELHYERVERVEAQLTAVADLIADHEGDEWAAHPATGALRVILDDQAPAASCSPDAPETEPDNPAATEATERPTLRERHRAQWLALTDTERAARIAALDEDDDVTGVWTPDPPIGCLTITTERTPSQLPGLRNDIARAIHRYDHEHALSGNDLPSKHHRGEADAVLRLLYREWPWLRAGAEDATPPA